MNILIIAPHPDDESIGCGGSICLHADRGDRVVIAFLTSGELGLTKLSKEEAWRVREGEAESVAEILGVAQLSFLRLPDGYLSTHLQIAAEALLPIIERETPQSISLPHESEAHPDHAMSRLIVERALQKYGGVMPLLLAYEVWTPLDKYNHVVDITDSMERKLSAIRRYRSQNMAHRFDQSCQELNRYRGYLAFRNRYAEAFQCSVPRVHGLVKNAERVGQI